MAENGAVCLPRLCVRIKLCIGNRSVGTGSYGSRGKGKRRFAAQGSWRSSSHSQGENEAVLWLHRPPDAPLPSTAPASRSANSGTKHSGLGKDEVHLTQLAREFWGTKGQSAFHDSLVDGVYSVIVKTKYVTCYDT